MTDFFVTHWLAALPPVGLIFPYRYIIIIARTREKTSTHIQVRYLPKGERKMSVSCIQNAKLEETGFNYTMSLIQGKYKMFILYALMGYGIVRFNELKRYIGSVSYKTLSATLKDREADGLIHREEYPQIPPKVEYSLTERGKSLIPILDAMCDWGEKNR